jgi:hypothetical protein
MNRTLKAETLHINFSTVGFRLAARDFLRCAAAFTPENFSIVPYFLCCRSIELSLKAIHLEAIVQADAKKKFSHDIAKAYAELPASRRTLNDSESELLSIVSGLYAAKVFEYVQPGDAAHGFSRFPDLDALSSLAQRVLAIAGSAPQ